MRRLIAALVVPACAAAAPAAAEARATCPLKRGYSVVTQNAKAVISVRTIRREDAEGSVDETKRYRGCWRRTGRAGPIASGELATGAGQYEELRHEGFVLSGVFVAWTTSFADKYFNSYHEIRAWNLATKRQARYATVSELEDGGGVSSFVLSPRGALAFILAGHETSTLWTFSGRSAPRLVDRGEIAALTRSGASIGWTNAGDPQTTELE